MTAKRTKQAKATETIVAAGQEGLRNFAKAGTESYEKAFAGVRDKAEELFQGYDEFAKNGKQQIEAWSAAGTTYGKGVEAIGGECVNFAKQALDNNVQVTKAILGAKSLNEVMDLQTDYARNSFEGLLARTTKVGEMATKVAQETAAPINAQVTATVEKLRKTAA